MHTCIQFQAMTIFHWNRVWIETFQHWIEYIDTLAMFCWRALLPSQENICNILFILQFCTTVLWYTRCVILVRGVREFTFCSSFNKAIVKIVCIQMCVQWQWWASHRINAHTNKVRETFYAYNVMANDLSRHIDAK